MNDTPCRSPCINICTLDEDGYCRGCYRTIQEIANWSLMTPSEQRELLPELKRRAQQRGPAVKPSGES